MMNFWASSHLSTIFSSPLVSSIVTLYALVLLYVPYQFMRIVFSPVLILTGILLLTLLRLGAIQRFEDDENNKKDENTPCQAQITEDDHHHENKESDDPAQVTGSQDEDLNWVDHKSETDSEPEMDFDPNPCFEDSFVQWNLRGPLEVIYEEDEEEEKNRVLGIEKYQKLSRYYYPDSDSDNSSENEFPATGFWDSPENMCFRWEEEDGDGLIEIALDEDGDHKRGLDFHVEEDNLIEIDISQSRNDKFLARNDDVSSSPASQMQLT